MNKGNERLLAILSTLRKMPRWALILLTIGVIIVLGVAMFLLLPQPPESADETTYQNATTLAFNVFLKMSVIVILIIGLAIILQRWKIKTNIGSTRQIKVEETLHLSTHRTLYLIESNGEKFLIGSTDHNIIMLHRFDIDQKFYSQNDTNNDFSSVLSKAQIFSKKSDN